MPPLKRVNRCSSSWICLFIRAVARGGTTGNEADVARIIELTDLADPDEISDEDLNELTNLFGKLNLPEIALGINQFSEDRLQASQVLREIGAEQAAPLRLGVLEARLPLLLKLERLPEVDLINTQITDLRTQFHL
ncbi:MAG: hypothetical protein ABI835_09730 [Chloroflexota bacterium]